MTPEVKKRIEQIRQGIVPEGYVKDKDGIYPRDWASKKIGQWLKLAERSIVLQDEEEYQLVTIRRGFGGVDSRGSFLGKNVLVKNYFIVKTGDFIISKRQIAHGACGIVLPELDGAVVSNEYNVFLPQDGTNIQMFNLMMQLPHYKRLFYLMSDGVHIEKLLFKTQDWMKRTLAMPLLKEQKKIAEILSTQDKAIELQGRKIEELKRFKKGCLEKMFPRKGQKVPEKRFPGFTDDWEQRKLGEVSKRVIVGLATSVTPYYREKGAPILRNLNIKENYLDDTDILFLDRTYAESQISKQIHAGDVLTVHTGYIGTSCVVPEKYDKCLTFTTLITTTDESVLKGAFLAQYLNSEIGMSAVQAVTTQGGRQNLNTNDFVKVEIRYPSLAEQNKICTVLSSIDNLITLHQRKLEEMKNQKKALMQLLLTGIVRVRL